MHSVSLALLLTSRLPMLVMSANPVRKGGEELSPPPAIDATRLMKLVDGKATDEPPADDDSDVSAGRNESSAVNVEVDDDVALTFPQRVSLDFGTAAGMFRAGSVISQARTVDGDPR